MTAPPRGAPTLPLEGIQVVAVEQAVAGPFASRQLADLGARVIKIERPGGGDLARRYDTTVRGLSSHFVWLNRSKESLTLDLKRPEAAAILEKLLGASDVFLHNLAPGAIDRMGFSAERLRASYPGLIVGSVSGYGSPGPFSNRKAYDLLIQAESGLLSITGTEDAPCKVSVPVADISAGMYLFSGVLAALIQRGRTGIGSVVDVAMLDALGEWMGYPAYYARYGGTPPARTGAHHATIAPYGPYPTGDGRVVLLAIQNEREWANLCEQVLSRPDMITDGRFATIPDRVKNRDALNAVIADVFGTLTADEVVARLDEARVANARMRSVQEFTEHPQLAARERWTEIDSPVGALRALHPPIQIDGVPSAMGPVPGVGEHTRPILEELGFLPDEIAALERDAII
ncbi:MAG: CaiB/BaiF CoA-transferase family protein [Longimicrobiales bacterium]|nr:CaiB/BaiF CoA-transferase family protein [Longimicrobiales bacterium]